MRKFPKRLTLSIIILTGTLIALQSCAYYNTFYNAEEYFAEAQKLTRENQSETVSREEINLYSKAIEKSKKLLSGYPDSKYRDDAQFVIAKSYYFKGDYLLAKRYFEDLSLNYSSSPHTVEVPLWIGRCLLKIGDLEMARHEASRIAKGKGSRALQADALLLMGEIAVVQDSLALAESYLEQVIDRSPDGFTKAQAQFQVGRMRENQADFAGALTAFESVAKYRPSESLKVEAIIRQTSMLKALNRDEDAVEMIQSMLLSDKFVDIRGQLEVELGKLFLIMDEISRAENKLKAIIEDYSRQDVAAEAAYVLGELYLTKKLDYMAAKEAYADVKIQSVRSDFVPKATQRIKQVDLYTKIQRDHVNLERQLAGLPPIEKAKKKTSKGRSNRRTTSRGRTRSESANPAEQRAQVRKTPEKSAVVDTVEVSYEDSLRFFGNIDENRYSLAEYMLFEFARVDTTLDILKTLESSTLDSSMKHQSAYMQYYAQESIARDMEAGQAAMNHIMTSYPDYYVTISRDTMTVVLESDPDEERFQEIASIFEAGNYAQASDKYKLMQEDTTLANEWRSKSCFNHAWLNDHYLYDKTVALEAYQYFVDHFSDEPLAETVRNRISALNYEPRQAAAEEPEAREASMREDPQEKPDNPEDFSRGPKPTKQGDKQGDRRD